LVAASYNSEETKSQKGNGKARTEQGAALPDVKAGK